MKRHLVATRLLVVFPVEYECLQGAMDLLQGAMDLLQGA
jgi:hypothetical protein